MKAVSVLALVLLVSLSGVPNPTRAAPGQVTYTDSFEAPPAGNDPLFSTPTATWFVLNSGSGSLSVDATQAHTGTQSLDVKQTSPWPNFVFSNTPATCDTTYTGPTGSSTPTSFSVWMRLQALPPFGGYYNLGLQGSSSYPATTTYEFEIGSDGALTAQIIHYPGYGNGFAAGTSMGGPSTITAGVWYQFAINNALCDAPTPNGAGGYNHASSAGFSVQGGGINLGTPVIGADTGLIPSTIFFSGNPNNGNAHNQFWLDDLSLSTQAPPIAPVANTNVTRLVGFAVDPFDQSAIARLNSPTPGTGQDVVSLDPFNLHVSGSFHEAGCNRVGGVATRYANGKATTSFLDCDSSGAINMIRVRNQNLGPPDQSGTACAGETFCDDNITAPFNSQGPPSNARDLGDIEAAPWDYTLGSTEPSCALCVKHVTLSWAYSEINGGHVGVYAITMNKNLPNAAATATQLYAPQGTVINDFCAWRDTTTRQDYIAATRNDGPTKIYRVTVTEQANGLAHAPNAALSLIYNGGGAFDAAVAIGCARDRVLVVTQDGRAVLANVMGQVLASFPAPQGAMRGAAMSLDGAFGVYASGGFYHVLDLINDTETLRIPIPPSVNLFYTGLDFNAKVLWSATIAGPSRYNIAATLKTQNVPIGSNRNLTTGALTTCTDAQGARSSYCTGVADTPPNPSATGTGIGSGSGSSSSSSIPTGTTTDSGTTGATSSTGTGSGSSTSNGATSSSSSTTGNGTGSGGGGGFVDLSTGSSVPLIAVGAVALVAVGFVVLTRRRIK